LNPGNEVHNWTSDQFPNFVGVYSQVPGGQESSDVGMFQPPDNQVIFKPIKRKQAFWAEKVKFLSVDTKKQE